MKQKENCQAKRPNGETANCLLALVLLLASCNSKSDELGHGGRSKSDINTSPSENQHLPACGNNNTDTIDITPGFTRLDLTFIALVGDDEDQNYRAQFIETLLNRGVKVKLQSVIGSMGVDSVTLDVSDKSEVLRLAEEPIFRERVKLCGNMKFELDKEHDEPSTPYDRRSAPRQPPEGPAPAKPGSAPR